MLEEGCYCSSMRDRSPAMHPGSASTLLAVWVWAVILASVSSSQGFSRAPAPEPRHSLGEGEPLLSRTRQLTFEGRRSGEGYYSRDGSRFIFQSEREEGNPFFQIYLMDMVRREVSRLSPGQGKTTCGWIHPEGGRVLFASTHHDPESGRKQREELERRASGRTRRYSWDFDAEYEIYGFSLGTSTFRNLTNKLGYDAEASWSPDGERIVFASNRLAYGGHLAPEQVESRDRDPSSFVDLYSMNSDGTDVRRLTVSPGYDGGPFFSPSGQEICWRRFTEDGLVAEIYLMDADGGRQRPVTRLGKMSWAPFFHPSGDYLVFTTNLHGLDNFELYLVAAEGRAEPLRATRTPGFDGLPVFSPDGNTVAWTSNRTPGKTSQIFLADWNDREARRLLELSAPERRADSDAAPETSSAVLIRAQDLRRHVNRLASEEMEGRMTGTRGELLATEYGASVLAGLGLKPAGDDGSYFQSFPFTAGVSLGSENRMEVVSGNEKKPLRLDRDWRPLSFSATGAFGTSQVVFAGYGIVAPELEENPGYDSYAHLDVAGKWVLVLRYYPEEVAPQRRRHLARYGSLRYKAMQALDRGAKGLLIASGPNSKVRRELIPLRLDGSVTDGRLPVISITDRVAGILLESNDRTLEELQDELDSGELRMGFVLPGVEAASNVDLNTEQRTGRNVLGLLQVGRSSAGNGVLVVGAHLDHLGSGATAASLARSDEEGGIHYGADDNASGVAAVLEIAEHLVHLRDQGDLPAGRDVLFALWSGEELGLLGSNHFMKTYGSGPGHGSGIDLLAYLNLDMVGRLKTSLVVQGVGSSSVWPSAVERSNLDLGLPIVMQPESHLPTDATSFYVKQVPILSLFTGSHEDYHTPGDRPEKINYQGTRKIASFLSRIAVHLLENPDRPDYQEMSDPRRRGARSGLRAYLGTIPDYAQGAKKGLSLSGVAPGGPAEKVGVRAGDLVVRLAGREIGDIYDYTYAIDFLEIGSPTEIVVVREGKKITLTIVPASRD